MFDGSRVDDLNLATMNIINGKIMQRQNPCENGNIIYELYTGNDVKDYMTRSITIGGNVWHALGG